jgi:phenylalanyl-tRNA synthetase beta subunit
MNIMVFGRISWDCNQKKSLAYALFPSPSKTLTDGDANKLRDKIVRRLEREIDAQLRS